MSPASYLTAPPRVAAASIASIAAMSSVAWGALGFFLFVLLAGTVTTAVYGFGLWRQIKAFRAVGDPLFAELEVSVAALERRSATFEQHSNDLQRAQRSLERSLRRWRILVGAWREATGTVDGWLAPFRPRA